MKLYELHIALKPDLSEEWVNKLISELGEVLAKNGFGITASQTRPNSRLTYPIKHCRDAHFLNIEISGPEDAALPEDVVSKLKRDENVLRSLVFAKPEKTTKRAKPFSIFSEPRPFRTERKPSGVSPAPTALTEKPAETAPMDVEEIDRKLEEIFK